jgi:CRP/FNR family transcriptional regulator, cyclic AMP receptor protein
MDRHVYIDERLAETELFRGLPAKKLRAVTSLTTRVDRPVGSLITREGRRGAEFVILLDGTVAVSTCDRVIANRGAGDFLGEISLLASCTQTATALVTSPVVAAVVSKPDFWSLVHEVPRVGDILQATMVERLANVPQG